MIPVVKIQGVREYGYIVVELDERTLGDLIEAALRRAYGDGYQDGQEDNIKDNRARPRGGNATA